jgi:hypothetical protein
VTLVTANVALDKKEKMSNTRLLKSNFITPSPTKLKKWVN